ncbi:GtrA family protein [Variovorax sp. OV329]|uniref:GtrA family protein n=1 Tax=Variovorax sp. OV329 TaxID=1882825 RepID=UPI0008F20475|nr:GtrA family protein [Variovorax sp. OV329]SFN07942.1 Putative flippase GtrA (transmembrane translocase of bactoprenol-linked glucose) [Variovorax sp. OV329]
MNTPRQDGRGLAALFMRFAGAGAVGTAAHYALLVALVSGLGATGWMASVAGSVVGALVNYTINYFWVFDSRPGHGHAFPRFMAVAGVGLAINAAAMYLLTVTLGLHYLVAQLLATALVLVVGFVLNARWTFGSKR